MYRRPKSPPESVQAESARPRRRPGRKTRNQAPPAPAPSSAGSTIGSITPSIATEGLEVPHRCLLVVDRSTPSCELLDLVSERCGRHAEVHVLVSRHRRSVLVPDPLMITGKAARAKTEIRVDDQRFHVTEARLASFIRALEHLGLAVSGEIVSRSPFRAVRRAMRLSAFDQVLVVEHGRSSRPERSWMMSRGPRRDLAARLVRGCPVPVTRLLQSASAVSLPIPGVTPPPPQGPGQAGVVATAV